MTSRSAILGALRARPKAPSPAPLPDLSEPFCTYSDPLQHFTAVLGSVGGKVVLAPTLEAAEMALNAEPAYQQARQVCGLVAGLGRSNVDLTTVSDPHSLETVDFAIARGRLAVAENGAVWVQESDVPTRALLFITQHLALVVEKDTLVNNMHEAYAQLELGSAEFGVFISGPSKTADIEQSLVIGAHGARSLLVFVIG